MCAVSNFSRACPANGRTHGSTSCVARNASATAAQPTANHRHRSATGPNTSAGASIANQTNGGRTMK